MIAVIGTNSVGSSLEGAPIPTTIGSGVGRSANTERGAENLGLRKEAVGNGEMVRAKQTLAIGAGPSGSGALIKIVHGGLFFLAFCGNVQANGIQAGSGVEI